MKRRYENLLMDTSGPGQGGVRLIWLGTAGIFITDGETGILIDPYVSRFSLGTVAFRLHLKPDRTLIRNWAEKLGKEKINAVIVSHSHFDHAVDAPYFAIEADAPLVGTESTLNVGRGAGVVDNKLIAARPGQTTSFGKFTVAFIESVHGPALLGRIPYPGTIDEPLIPPAAAGKYRLGGVFALLITHPAGTILHHGSAGFKPGMYDGIVADVLLLGISGRGNTDQYLENVALKTKAKLVIPIHVDNFFKPLEDGMSFLPTVKFGEFCRKAQKYRAMFMMRTIPLCREVKILPLNPIPAPEINMR